jgi:hypothetical protein
MDQPKLERLLRLMKMLTANNSLTVDEIATNWVFRPVLFIAISTPFGMPGLSLKKRITAPSSTSLRLISRTLAGSFTSPKKKTTISSSPLSKALTKTTAVDKLLIVLHPSCAIAKLERMGVDLTIQTQKVFETSQASERSPQTDTCGGKNKPTELKIGNS